MVDKFEQCLEVGERFELMTMGILNMYYNLGLIKNPNKLGVDLTNGVVGIEVKRDDKSIETGNYFVEFECSGKPSGVYKYDCRYWVHGTKERFGIYKRLKLIEHMKAIGLVKEQAGDGGRVKGWTTFVGIMEEKAERIFTINKE